MEDGPLTAFRTTIDQEPHLIAMVLLLPFLAIFLRAAWLEYRRWRRYGPSGNDRSRFPIDTSAPSYEHGKDD